MEIHNSNTFCTKYLKLTISDNFVTSGYNFKLGPSSDKNSYIMSIEILGSIKLLHHYF